MNLKRYRCFDCIKSLINNKYNFNDCKSKISSSNHALLDTIRSDPHKTKMSALLEDYINIDETVSSLPVDEQEMYRTLFTDHLDNINKVELPPDQLRAYNNLVKNAFACPPSPKVASIK
jgi:hypothetical protein